MRCACSIWTVWFGFPESAVCVAFNFSAVIFGVDAAPAALVGSALLTMEIEPGSAAAIRVVPVITFWVAVWLLVFFVFKAGKLVSYISAPVMGGFITGICTDIILMQLPKLMGGSPGTGELPELLKQIFVTAKSVNIPSLFLGILALAILITGKKMAPKFPMAVVLMAAGAVLAYFCPSLMEGIHTLDTVERGLPVWSIPSILSVPLADVITISLSIALVIMTETLLAENSFAMRIIIAWIIIRNFWRLLSVIFLPLLPDAVQ